MTDKKRNTSSHKGRTIFLMIVLLLLLVVGLVLMFNEPIKRALVHNMSEQTLEQPLNQKSIKQAEQLANGKKGNKANQKENDEFKDFKVDYNFSKVKPLSIQEVTRERLKHRRVPLVGKIAIPSVNLLLPIVPGVSNASLSAGAGTLKKDEVIGVGNYALASHNMNDYVTLFSPLLKIQTGALMYVTNGQKVFVYKVKTKRYIAPTEVDVIRNHQNKRELTLITCSMSGNQRLLVQGPLVKTESYQSQAQLFQS